ncbi:MAG: AsmA-like C-terminal region-containing protein, partial [Acidobacteriaceae bacterium]
GPVVLELDNFSASAGQSDLTALHAAPDTLITGDMHAERARFGNIHVRNLRSALRIAPEQVTLKNFRAKTYRGHASGDFTLNLAGINPRFHSDLDVTGIGVTDLLGEFDSGPPKMTGMMQAKLTVGGQIAHTATPLDDMAGAGQFNVRKGQLPSLNQNKSMAEMKRFRSTSAAAKPASAFSTFSGDIELKNRRIYNRKIIVDFYGVSVQGGGSLDYVSGALNYRGAATIEKKQGFFTSTFARLFKGAEEKQGLLTFPIQLEGTLAHPQFTVLQ